MRKPLLLATVAILIVALLTSSHAEATELTMPDLTLRVAVRQKEDGKVAKGIHILTLQCASGDCSLTSVSMNQCGENFFLEAPSFPVVVEVSSTRDGTLRVTQLGNTLKVEERASDIGGVATNNFLFGYELFDGIGGPSARLTSFSGGFVKHSTLLNNVITVEYVPFRRLVQAAKLDCAVRLPGLDLSEFDDLIESLSASDRAAWQRIAKDPTRPLLNDDERGRRLFPEYDKMVANGTTLSDEQWHRYVDAYLEEQDEWLTRGGVSAPARVKIRNFQSEVLLEQLKRN